MKIRAISIRQPWADAIVCGLKDVENRRRNTNIRGAVLIQAGKTWDPEGEKFFKDECLYKYFNGNHWKMKDWLRKADSRRGGLVGAAFLTGCFELQKNPLNDPGIWAKGPYCWKMESPFYMTFRPWTGRLGWFKVNIRRIKPPIDMTIWGKHFGEGRI